MENVKIAKSLKNLRFFNDFGGFGVFGGIQFNENVWKSEKNEENQFGERFGIFLGLEG